MQPICASSAFCSILITVGIWVAAANGGKPYKIASTANKEYFIDEDSIHETVDFGSFMRYCHEHGLQGATIKNEGEQLAIEEFYHDTKFTSHFRLAGLFLPSEGGWVWLDDFKSFERNYQNWDIGQPDKNPGESCLVFYKNSTKWHDFPCTLSPGYKALCQNLL